MMLFPAGEAAAQLRRSFDELRHAHDGGAGGHELARRRADLVDFALISLFRDAEQQTLAGGLYRASGVAVVALGGYGRRELCPFSDIDLMLLYRPE
jgi:[protein-PII] uridylyltransferase